MNHDDQTMSLSILIVDDEVNIRKTLAYCLNADGHSVISVSNPADAAEEAQKRSFDLAFLDLRLGEENGMALVPLLLSNSPWIKIVVITAHASIESAVEAMKKGATDYIAKPFTPDQIRFVARGIGRIRKLENQVAALKENMQREDPVHMLQTKNVGMQRVIENAKKAAASEATILLCGESGTGKSVFARAIHSWSARAKMPLGVLACPAVPPDLLESELFGHVKGAFTGAVRDNPGRIAACEGGTLFLDEIGDVVSSVQAKLLRFLQDKEYERIGESKVRKANVRIIAATNADLEKRVADGRFREDLFYRLNVISLTIPPLRDRPEDILTLSMDFMAYFSRTNHKSLLGFTDGAKQMLTSYAWPGNVRELRNAIERAVILGCSDRIGTSDFPNNISPTSVSPAIGDMVPLSTIEELHIRRIIAGTASLQAAADVLGIDHATLWRKRRAYRI